MDIKTVISQALKSIGLRNVDLHNMAIETVQKMLEIDSVSAKWIARDVLRALQKEDLKMLHYPSVKYRK